jgi:hypothetical protein
MMEIQEKTMLVCKQNSAIVRLYDDLLEMYTVTVETPFYWGMTRDASNPGDVYMSDTGVALGPHSVDFESLKH